MITVLKHILLIALAMIATSIVFSHGVPLVKPSTIQRALSNH